MNIENLSKEEWQKAHSDPNIVTASQVASVLGINPYKSAFTLYHEKVGALPPDPENTAMKIGKALEPVVADLYTEETGRKVEDFGDYAMHYSKEFPQLRGTLDRWDTEMNAPVELKTSLSPSANAIEDWEIRGGPLMYQVQVQAQMWLTGSEIGFLAGLLGRQFKVAPVTRNDKFIAWMLERVKVFLDHVAWQKPLPMDFSDSTVATVRKLYPDDDGTTILRPDLKGVVQDLISVQTELGILEKREKELKGQLIAEIGAHSGMNCDGYTVTYKAQTRGSYTVPAAKFRVLKVK